MAAGTEVEENHHGCRRLCEHGSDVVFDRGDENDVAEYMGPV